MDYKALIYYPCDRCKELHEMKAMWSQEAMEDIQKSGLKVDEYFMLEIIHSLQSSFENTHPYDIFDPEVLIMVRD